MSVSIEKSDDIWTFIHDRPEARNAMDPESADALVAAFEEFDKSAAKVGVLWGAGGTFCAGFDLKYAATATPANRAERPDLSFPLGSAAPPRGPLGPTRMELSKPVIGAIEGPAVAGGMELAMWCDIRVMAEDAYMGVYCRRWGIPLMDGGTVRLPRLIGQGKALEITLTGRKVSAEECYAIGLCEKVEPTGTTRQAAEVMAREIARFPQDAMLADRRSIIEGQGLSIRDALKLEWANGSHGNKNSAAGAARFASGVGRHGDFTKI